MSSQGGSIRLDSISCRDAGRLLQSRVAAVADDSDPAPWHDVHRELINMFAGGDEAAYVRRAKLWERTKLLMLRGLLGGELRAHFSDEGEAQDIPGWAWVGTEKQVHAWMDSRLPLDALLPDDWQRWSCHQVFMDRTAFPSWIDRQNLASIAGLPNLPLPYDGDERPDPVKHRLPPDRPFVTLSEAVSWIAFGISFDRDRLIRAIDDRALGRAAETQTRLERAVVELTTLASGGKVCMRGKYMVDELADHCTALTETIDPVRFHDFAQFDCHADALRYGQGLTWVKSDTISQILLSKRHEAIQSVTVNRANVMRYFPITIDSAQALAAQSIAWCDFGADRVPDLVRLNELASRDEWWTWPEAIAWVGGRDSRNIATLRFWGQEWSRRSDGDATITISAQAYIARQYCNSASQAEADLINAIERGAVQTSGRADRDAKSAPLAKGDWRGGTVVYSDGVAQLVSAKNKLIAWAFDIAVNRADLVKHFPAPAQQERPSSEAVSSAHALPSDDRIRDKMIELKNAGLDRDGAAKQIRTIPGFEHVGNEHARRVAAGHFGRGRPKKRAAN